MRSSSVLSVPAEAPNDLTVYMHACDDDVFQSYWSGLFVIGEIWLSTNNEFIVFQHHAPKSLHHLDIL